LEWLVIIGLSVWVWLQSRRIDTLMRKLGELERLFGERANTPQNFAASAATETAPAPAAAAEEEPLLLDTPIANDEPEPLLLDTPVPEASNDIDEDAPPLAPPRPMPQVLVTRTAPLELTTPAPAIAKRERRFDQWLAENGLAWLGGALLAFGAVYLVTVASQQDWFTPEVQLGCAVGLGVLLLAASEWTRRIGSARAIGHPLVAAMLAGASVVAFYVTAWAAYAIYDVIELGHAVAALTLCATLLIGLSYLHGQPLGVLAIAAMLLAPALTEPPDWPPDGLTLFLCTAGAAGFALAALRRWAWTAAAALAGLYFWFGHALLEDEVRRALALLSVASLGGVATAFRVPDEADQARWLSWRRAQANAPSIAIAISSVLLVWVWLAMAPAPSGVIGGPAWVGAMFVALAAPAVRLRVAPAAAFTVAVIALSLGFIGYLRARFHFGPLSNEFYPFVLFASVVVAISAIGARPHHSGRMLVAATGAVGSAVLTTLAAFSREEWHSLAAWAPLFVGAALLFGAAVYTSRDAPDPSRDSAVDVWAGAGAALVLLGIESAIPEEARATAHAGAALMFACGVVWERWNGLRFAALTAAAIAVAHAMAPSFIAPVMAGETPLWGALFVLIVTAGLLFGAGYFLKRVPHLSSGEAADSAGVLVLLIGAFLTLSFIAVGASETPRLDQLSEEALRALVLLAAGHVVMVRPGQDAGRLARWRGHALFGAGLAYVFVLLVLVEHPWWGPLNLTVGGPPIIDGVLLAYGAPAALSLAAAYRLYAHERLPARIYAAAGGALALIWALTEARRLFHGALLQPPDVGVFEAACYGLTLLAFAYAVVWVVRRREARAEADVFTHDLARVMRGVSFAALLGAGLIMLIARHPWWGGQLAAASDALATGLGVLAQAVAAGLCLALARGLSLEAKSSTARYAAAATAMLFAWSFGHAAIRWLYHQGGMDDGAALIGLEGMAQALWPLAFVLIAAEAVERAPRRDAVRPYLYDVQAIAATAVWPALAFAALGVWLLFNPWWGVVQTAPASRLSTTLAPAAPILAAWLSCMSARVSHIRAPAWYDRAATGAAIVHLLVAVTLLVRWLYHATDMRGAPVLDLEMWSYSAAWAIFGAAVFGLGLRRNEVLLRWAGLAILILTFLYVVTLAMVQLDGIVRVGSVLGLAIVLLAVAWAAKNHRPKPTDLLPITPSARRERRHGRRQRTP
jgi:uncharacterized membrane protein